MGYHAGEIRAARSDSITPPQLRARQPALAGLWQLDPNIGPRMAHGATQPLDQHGNIKVPFSMNRHILGRAVDPQRLPVPFQTNRRRVGSVENQGSIQQDQHSKQLHPAIYTPRLAVAPLRNGIKDKQVRRPDSDWPKVVQNRMPHAAHVQGDCKKVCCVRVIR